MDKTQDAAWQRFDRFLRWTIEIERPAAKAFLPEDERASFLAYYAKLPKPGDEAAIERYVRGMWRGETGWVARWLHVRQLRASAEGPRVGGNGSGRADGEGADVRARSGDGWIGCTSRPRVMDAGSGFGTYSMMFAAMGAEVTGADLRPDRLSAAKRRLQFYRENTGCALRVDYQRLDLTGAWPHACDLVWVHNALSHIDPLDAFLQRVRESLRRGGLFVVGDINGELPSHLKRLAALRSDVHQEYVAPDGTRHGYAMERPFPPGELRKLVQGTGLTIVHHELYWGGLGVLPDLLYRGLIEPAQCQWWMSRRFARRQLMVAAA